MDTNYHGNRLSPSSSELAALLTLSPPSPTLSCSELSTSITSGDIPILLDGLDISDLRTFPSSSTLKGGRISVDESIYDAYLFQSDSTASFGTFGPVHKLPNSTYTEASEHLADEEPLEWPTATFLRLQSRPSLSNMEMQESAAKWCDMNIDNSSSAAEWQLQSQEQFIHAKRSGSQRTTVAPTIQSSSPDLAADSVRLEQPGAEVESPPSKLLKLRTSVNHYSKKSLTGANQKAFEMPYVKEVTCSWLNGVKVLLSIDQEGFRSITPSFKFVQCVAQTVGDKQLRKQNMAQFVPVNRQTFYFHYAPFDGLPVLRRIYVNEDEDHDYISREATLALKSNGLYVVRGSEMGSHLKDDDNRSQHDATDLCWEFVYKVDDRRVGASRKLIDGEKNFMPLSFSCSPALLRPGQRKKINLVHVVKKSITARLAAEKMTVCELDLKLAKALNSARLPYHDAANGDSNLHRRALSYGLQQGIQSTSVARPTLYGPMVRRDKHSDNDDNDSSRSSRRRRASSAGEWSGRDCRHKPEGEKLTRSPPIQKHIVNPAILAQMLTQDTQAGSHPLRSNHRSFHTNNAL